MNDFPNLSKFPKSQKGLARIALKMMFRDRVKYLILLGAFVFSTLLMTQQAAVFCGIMDWTGATIKLLQAPIWIMDPKMEQVNEPKPVKNTDLARVRSVSGIDWAVGVHSSVARAKLENGDFKMLQLIGIDSTSLIGHPTEILEGKIEDLLLPNAIFLDELAVDRFKMKDPKTGQPMAIKRGDVLELNDREARILGIFRAPRTFMGMPYAFTTYERAVDFAPLSRRMTSFILAAPNPSISNEALAQKIEQETGLMARTADQFYWDTLWYFIKNTGIPISFGTTVLLGLIVGMVVSGQTFYAFVMENIRHLATLKAMGLSHGHLGKMLILQSFTVGLFGYGIGMGLTAAFGWSTLKKQEPPFLLPLELALLSLLVVLIICSFTCYLGWRQVKKVEAGLVFRA